MWLKYFCLESVCIKVVISSTCWSMPFGHELTLELTQLEVGTLGLQYRISREQLINQPNLFLLYVYICMCWVGCFWFHSTLKVSAIISSADKWHLSLCALDFYSFQDKACFLSCFLWLYLALSFMIKYCISVVLSCSLSCILLEHAICTPCFGLGG